MDKYLGGTTKKFTWISSGKTPTAIASTILDSSDSLVSSESMTSSGNGHYYAAMTLPTTADYYVKEMTATVSGKLYKDRESFQIVLSEVD